MAFGPGSLSFVEQMYARYLEDPSSVGEDWRGLFEPMADAKTASLGPSFKPRSIFNPKGAAGAPEAKPTPQAAGSAPDASERIPFLRSLAFFKNLSDAQLKVAAQMTEAQQAQDGDVFVREGALGDDIFIITSGRALIRRGGRAVAEVGRGEVVGEMAALDRRPRSADAVAHGPVTMLRLSSEALHALIDREPAIARGIIEVLTQRLRDSSTRQDRVDQLIRAYRVRGHLIAALDPLDLPKERTYPELNPAYYGFSQADLDMLFSSTTIPGSQVMTLRSIIAHLRKTYCGSIGVQFMHIDDLQMKMWLQNKMETTQNTVELGRQDKLQILTKLTDAEIFERFIHRKFIGAKRFSLEGAESLVPLLDMAIEEAGLYGVEEIVIGMAHRGRLNVLANVMGKSPRQIFHEFDDSRPTKFEGKGDVKYHLGYSADRLTSNGQKVHLSLSFNPSHLEFVSPVVIGRVRAKQDRFGDEHRKRGMGILIHGDAAFAGQGVVQETFNLSQLGGYRTGGSLHIIVNNQIGFTTDPEDARSTHYSSDVAKMLQIPIFHVNGEHPEAVAQAIKLAMAFRDEFAQDVVIDMYCYRRHGHNEGDEPAFTQPLMYKAIRKRISVREGYLQNLGGENGVSQEEADRIVKERTERLESELGAARAPDYQTIDISYGQGIWQGYKGGPDNSVPQMPTAVDREVLRGLLQKLSSLPGAFNPHPKIARMMQARAQVASGERALDWAAGEALAFATLLTEGTRVRLCGQDVGRGTFSHRHVVLHDVDNGRKHVPLRHLSPDQGRFDVFNSPLTETGVVAFEYGYSLDTPDGLVLWEAQFGDFANVAQVIFDQFITSAEDKWRRLSGFVMVLPHGFEGQGPEHSSARLERFLNSAAEDNIQVVNLTTPAQLFHLLRRQVVRPYRKPLVIMSPKSLLRHPQATSSLEELCRGGFMHVIPDRAATLRAAEVNRVVLTSGKIYYELKAARDERETNIPIIRMEQYYPLDLAQLQLALEPYPAGAEVVWVQEEPMNMGAWPYIQLKLSDRGRLMGRELRCISRPESASPATGSAASHKVEQAKLIASALSTGN